MKSWPPAPQLLHLMSQAFPHRDKLCVRTPMSFWAARGASVVPEVLLAHKNFHIALVHAGISCYISASMSEFSTYSALSICNILLSFCLFGLQ